MEKVGGTSVPAWEKPAAFPNQQPASATTQKVASATEQNVPENIPSISKEKFPKGDPLLGSTPKVDFAEVHQAAMKKVENFEWRVVKGKDIYLDSIDAKGGGAAAFRELFIEYQKRELQGDIYLVTPGSGPNLFYLYMGMVPYETDPETKKKVSIADIQMDYVDTLLPNKNAHAALEAFEQGKDLSDEDKDLLKQILHQETAKRGGQLQPDHTLITDQELMDNKDLLLELKDKKISKMEGEFIPNVLKDMQDNIGKKKVTLTSTGAQSFKMTEEGFKRAGEAIAKGEKIESFKNLEHLPMNPEQRKEFEQIMEKRRNMELK